PLPGGFDQVRFFNSNSPEMVTGEGILLSTFPPEGKKFPQAHLNQVLTGRFDIFTHHITPRTNLRTLYQGIIMKNPGSNPVNLKVISSATYLTADAPFIKLP